MTKEMPASLRSDFRSSNFRNQGSLISGMSVRQNPDLVFEFSGIGTLQLSPLGSYSFIYCFGMKWYFFCYFLFVFSNSLYSTWIYAFSRNTKNEQQKGIPVPSGQQHAERWSTQDKFAIVVETASLCEAELKVIFPIILQHVHRDKVNICLVMAYK